MSSGFRARYWGICDDCGAEIKPGEVVGFNALNELVHMTCPDPLPKAGSGEVTCPECFLIHPEGACDHA